MKCVLLITYDFPPRGGTGVFRVAKFTRYLPEWGWQPVVVTATIQGGIRDEALLAELPLELEVIRVADPLARIRIQKAGASTISKARSGVFPRIRRLFIPDPQITWLPVAVQAASTRLRRRDIAVCMTSSPPHSVQLGGLWLKRCFPDLPWLMDLRDIWSDSSTVADPLTYKLNRLCESACLRRADHVTVVTDGIRALLQRNFSLPAARISTITNGFDPADIPETGPQPIPAAFRLTFVGTLLGTLALAARGFFGALGQLLAEGITANDLQVRLVGRFDPQVHAWAAPMVAAGIVQILPFVPHAAAVAEMAAADVLLLIVTDDWEGRIVLTNKLFEYLAVGRPVLALAPEGEITRLIREADVGVIVSPSAISAIAEAIRTLIAQHKANLLPRYTRNDPRFARFDRRVLAKELAARLDGLVS